MLKIFAGAIGGGVVTYLMFQLRVREDYRKVLFERKLQAITDLHESFANLYTLAAMIEENHQIAIPEGISREIGNAILMYQRHVLFLSPDLYSQAHAFTNSVSVFLHNVRKDTFKEGSPDFNRELTEIGGEWRKLGNAFFNTARKELRIKGLLDPKKKTVYWPHSFRPKSQVQNHADHESD